ncbi:syntaxin-16-like isoform X2 [Gordionus sp. m RMFG-2023]|uniref:syntaxin-16-like isoform X2 n=1 Tax=Gordionus sp. m RMFG-2023 TaxID=3053472 RepID=UPI0031FCCD03
MASNNLYDIYVLLRNNAIQTRRFFTHQENHNHEDKVSLMQPNKNLEDIEMGISGSNTEMEYEIPKWLDIVEEVNYGITKIKQKVKELDTLHQQQSSRPTFDEYSPLENEIQSKSHQLVQMLSHCQTLAKKLSSFSTVYSPKSEKSLHKNITSYLVTTLCELTSAFRLSQSNYLKQIERRKTIYSDIMNLDDYSHKSHLTNKVDTIISSSDTAIMQETAVIMTEKESNRSNNSQPKNSYQFDPDILETNFQTNHQIMIQDQKQSKAPLFLLEQEENFYAIREKEVQNLVKSITDLNVIFKDLSQIVVEQGTLVDRIDYNMEKSSAIVASGLSQLTRASAYQKSYSHKKFICILLLAFLVVFMAILLILFKI